MIIKVPYLSLVLFFFTVYYKLIPWVTQVSENWADDEYQVQSFPVSPSTIAMIVINRLFPSVLPDFSFFILLLEPKTIGDCFLYLRPTFFLPHLSSFLHPSSYQAPTLCLLIQNIENSASLWHMASGVTEENVLISKGWGNAGVRVY